MSDLLACELGSGQRVRLAFLVNYLPGCAGPDSPTEAVEIVVDSGRSVLLSYGTDWTLKVSAGRWPKLPEFSAALLVVVARKENPVAPTKA